MTAGAPHATNLITLTTNLSDHSQLYHFQGSYCTQYTGVTFDVIKIDTEHLH